ncbi:MAG: OprO/OprP family phosphate-selective porin [Tannerellaceae bacterium]|nr:OprO/OprP family phosphate-selective porin [Tannerellaceae bacterium]MCD8264769.1 OprO/OprP family phosphate-selective porin [Tannerellaceae bacterium]
MVIKKTLTLCWALYTCVLAATAHTPPIDWKLSGRLFIDGGAYVNSPPELHNDMHISEIRLGTKMRYQTHWYAKIDIGFANNKVALKDAYLQYSKEDNYFRAGYMLGFFSMDQSTSTNDYVFHTGSNITETYYPGRRTGISYTRSVENYYCSFDGFMGDGLTRAETIKPGYNFTGRYVWRPINQEAHVFHLGTGALFRIPDKDTETGKRPLSLKTKGVTYMPSVQLLDLSLEDVDNQSQTNVEYLFFHRKWLLQGEYLLMKVKQPGTLPGYTSHGGYLMAGFLLKGNAYGYDLLDALPEMPVEPRSLLLACRYNYTNLNDKHSQLYGGRQHDISAGLNYYVNAYISTRLNYTHLWMDKHSTLRKNNIHIPQARLQIRF